MAPTEEHLLSARQFTTVRCPSGTTYRNGTCQRNAWSSYGRWILAAGLIVFLLIFLFLWACINARRRRKNGLQPRYGTGWVGNKFGGGNNYNNNPQAYSAPPAYGAATGQYPPQQGYNAQQYPMQNQYTGNTFQTTDGYYGQHEGIQQPKNTYQSNNDIYAPPEGPPPGKVVR